jgi:hypothetical protein
VYVPALVKGHGVDKSLDAGSIQVNVCMCRLL